MSVYTISKPKTKRPSIKPKGIKSVPDEVRLLLVDEGDDGAVIPLDRYEPLKPLTLEDMKNNFATPERAGVMGFMDQGLMYDPNHLCPRFPSSRDWNIPTVKCSRRTCVANYGGNCTMLSLIEIGPKGCKGYHKRASGKKK